MRQHILLFLLALAPSVLLAQHTEIESGTITFSFVKKEVSGSISGFNSTSTIDWNNLENSVISGQVASKTIKTGNFIRDFALRRPGYFNADDYPFITYKSSKVALKGAVIFVEGNLTIKGISKPLTIMFQKNGTTLTGTATLFTSDFDINILKKSREGNKVEVTFTLQLNQA